jgi:hypothetical protein
MRNYLNLLFFSILQQPICTNADALCSAKTGRLQLLTALKSNNLYYFDNSSYNYKHLLYYNISLKKIMNTFSHSDGKIIDQGQIPVEVKSSEES